ncbi:MAG: hypothetical protein FWD67_05020 [Betaproteobacteria bacterium]|nr:hypothetical protein [Betaproteobacteria bacterium]
MKKCIRLYRAEFYATCPKGQIGSARFRQCGTVVGTWSDVVDAFERSHREYWTEVFDAITDKRLIGPLAPGSQMTDLVRKGL